MKIEILATSVELLKQLLEELNLPDTIENREMMITVCLNTGIAMLAFSAGAMILVKEKTGIDPLESKPEQKQTTLIDGLCASCQVRPVKLPDGRTVCNCRVW